MNSPPVADEDILNDVASFMNRPKEPNYSVTSVGCKRWEAALDSLLDKNSDVYSTLVLSPDEHAYFSTPPLSTDMKSLLREEYAVAEKRLES